MSDLCLYEFEDITWDEFCQSDDHIVPHPGYGQADNHCHPGDHHKKTRCEVTDIPYSTEERFSAGYVDQGSEKGVVSALIRRNTMLEKDSWSHAPSGVFPSSSDGDSIKEAPSLASENTSPSSHAFKNSNVDSAGNELCGNDAILGDNVTDVDNSSSSDPLGNINHTGDNLDFFENSDKDSSDFLYYSWPEIENFEDVDKMFRSCDSTFGLGASKDDALDWFSSADNIEESEVVMNPDFKFSCPDSNLVENILPDHDSSKSYSFNDSSLMSEPIKLKDSPWMSEKPDSFMCFVNGSDTANGKERFIPKAQCAGHVSLFKSKCHFCIQHPTREINDYQKQAKLHKQPDGKRKEPDSGNGCFSHMNEPPNEVVQLPSRPISHQAFPSVRMQQQQQRALGSDSCNYLQNQISFVHSDTSPLSDLTSANPTSSVVKSETNDLTSPSPRDSSHASNQFPSAGGCHDPSLPVVAPTGTAKGEKLHSRQGRSSLDSSLKQEKTVLHPTLDDPGSISKEVRYPGSKSENHSDIEGGGLFIPAEFGSSNKQESSTMSSGMDDISLEAASFRQLQHVMEQLDLRTKICIRDSLYRLARSAELRHNHANLNSGCGNGRDANGAFMAEGENKYDFMDIETDTNPIDRSIAHLLFHRPSESSPIPAHDSLPFKSPSTLIRGSITGPPVMVEILNSNEETTSDVNASVS